MPDDLYAFDETAMRRITDAVRWVERHARDLPSPVDVPHPPGTLLRIGITYEAIAKGASGPVKFLFGPVKGSETQDSQTTTAYNRFSAFEVNKKILLAYIQGGWEIIGGEC